MDIYSNLITGLNADSHALEGFNPKSGKGIALIPQMLDRIPSMKQEGSKTHKDVLMISHYSCSCCGTDQAGPNTDITILVRVYCCGTSGAEMTEVNGHYLVNYSHYPDSHGEHTKPRIKVNKLSQKTIFCDGVAPRDVGENILF
jgi:hypothetical protein